MGKFAYNAPTQARAARDANPRAYPDGRARTPEYPSQPKLQALEERNADGPQYEKAKAKVKLRSFLKMRE